MLVQRLYDLDRSSIRFPEQLSELMRDVEWVGHLQHLPEGELVGLISYLDEVRFNFIRNRSYSSPPQTLECLNQMGSPFRDCLHILRAVCSSRMVLPPTYEVSGTLSFGALVPAACGEFSNVYRGTLHMADVCIVRLRESLATDHWTTAKQVPHLHNI